MYFTPYHNIITRIKLNYIPKKKHTNTTHHITAYKKHHIKPHHNSPHQNILPHMTHHATPYQTTFIHSYYVHHYNTSIKVIKKHITVSRYKKSPITPILNHRTPHHKPLYHIWHHTKPQHTLHTLLSFNTSHNTTPLNVTSQPTTLHWTTTHHNTLHYSTLHSTRSDQNTLNRN